MQNSKAYTLIELLVVISMVIIFIGMAFAAYNNFGQKKNVEKESQKIVNVISLAKTKTISGDASHCTSPPAFPEVDFYFVRYLGSTSYQLMPSCLAGTASGQTHSLSSGVTISSNFGDIRFSKLGGSATATCFEVVSGSECRFIQVTAQGVINEGVCGALCP